MPPTIIGMTADSANPTANAIGGTVEKTLNDPFVGFQAPSFRFGPNLSRLTRNTPLTNAHAPITALSEESRKQNVGHLDTSGQPIGWPAIRKSGSPGITSFPPRS